MEISLGVEETVMEEFRTFFPLHPLQTNTPYQKEETHLYQSEASAGFNYLFTVCWYSSGESITNMAAMRCTG